MSESSHPREVSVGAYRIVDDLAALDMDMAHRALSRDSYWARGRGRSVTEHAFANSRVAVALDAQGATAGFARAVTDAATFGYLADVWVEPAHRGRGLGRAVTSFLVEAPDLTGIRRWMLLTSDAQSLYAQFGFTPIPPTPTAMTRVRDTW